MQEVSLSVVMTHVRIWENMEIGLLGKGSSPCDGDVVVCLWYQLGCVV